ncbi:MAG: twin-arginine translocase TatA/TatE family subunit, partial [Leptotrichia hongkongensis]
MGIFRDIGAPGLIVLILGALLIFGPKRLPELGEAIGKMIREFKKSVSGIDLEKDDKVTEDKKEHLFLQVFHSTIPEDLKLLPDILP